VPCAASAQLRSIVFARRRLLIPEPSPPNPAARRRGLGGEEAGAGGVGERGAARTPRRSVLARPPPAGSYAMASARPAPPAPPRPAPEGPRGLGAPRGGEGRRGPRGAWPAGGRGARGGGTRAPEAAPAAAARSGGSVRSGRRRYPSEPAGTPPCKREVTVTDISLDLNPDPSECLRKQRSAEALRPPLARALHTGPPRLRLESLHDFNSPPGAITVLAPTPLIFRFLFIF
jgi:hypothetical protein